MAATTETHFRTNSGDYPVHLQKVLEKLKADPITITTEDARRLHEHYNAVDPRSARLISAIEAFAAAHDEIIQEDEGAGALVKTGHASLPTLIQDLHSAVDKNPGDVTMDDLRLTQGLLSKMQKVVGTPKAPKAELEGELEQGRAQIAHKVQQGIVTKAEANLLRSLETRAHGHIEKGGITATAQSVAAERNRGLSLSGSIGDSSTSPGSGDTRLAAQEQLRIDKENNLKKAESVVRSKLEHQPEHISKEDAALLESRERRAHGYVEKGSLAAEVQSLADKNANLHQANLAIRSKIEKEPEKITKEDAAQMESAESKAHGSIGKGSLAAQAQSIADKHEQQTAV